MFHSATERENQRVRWGRNDSLRMERASSYIYIEHGGELYSDTVLLSFALLYSIIFTEICTQRGAWKTNVYSAHVHPVTSCRIVI